MAQDDLFSQLQEASYAGIVFPVTHIKLTTGSSAAFHEFPYRAGCMVEYTGREAVSGSLEVPLYRGMKMFPNQDLWPGTLNKLREKAQEQQSFELIIPTLGSLPKAWIRIHEDYSWQRRNGAMVSIEFREDSMDRFIKQLTVNAYGKAINAANLADFKLSNLGYGANIDDTFNPGSKTFAQALRDAKLSLDAANERLSQPLRDLELITERVDELLGTVIALKSASNWEARKALLEVKDGVFGLIEAFNSTKKIVGFVTPAVMSAAEISSSTGSSIEEILSLNMFSDANSISAGELVLVVQK